MAIGNRVVRGLPLARRDGANVRRGACVSAHQFGGLACGVLERAEALAHQQLNHLGQCWQKIGRAVLLAGGIQLRAEHVTKHVAQVAERVLQFSIERVDRRLCGLVGEQIPHAAHLLVGRPAQLEIIDGLVGARLVVAAIGLALQALLLGAAGGALGLLGGFFALGLGLEVSRGLSAEGQAFLFGSNGLVRSVCPVASRA